MELQNVNALVVLQDQLADQLEAAKLELSQKEGELDGLRLTVERLGMSLAGLSGTLGAPRTSGRGGKRMLSPEARQRIQEAQRKRWDKVRQLKSGSEKPKTVENEAEVRLNTVPIHPPVPQSTVRVNTVPISHNAETKKAKRSK